jgi:hypothetical protein
LQSVAVASIQQEQLAGGDLREVTMARIDEEAIALRRDRDTEVIGDGFRHSQTREPAERRRKIDAELVIALCLDLAGDALGYIS